MRKANENTLAALEDMQALSEGFPHPMNSEIGAVGRVSQGLVLYPMPGFMVPIINISPGMAQPSICVLISGKKVDIVAQSQDLRANLATEG